MTAIRLPGGGELGLYEAAAPHTALRRRVDVVTLREVRPA